MKYVRTPDGRIMTYRTRTYVYYQDTEVPDDEIQDLLAAADRARITLTVRSTPTVDNPTTPGTGPTSVSVDDVVGLPQLLEDLRVSTQTQIEQEVTRQVDAIDTTSSFAELTDVDMAEVTVDPQGNVTGGPEDGAGVFYDLASRKLKVIPINPARIPLDSRYVEAAGLPAGFPRFFVPQQVIDTPGETEDPELPVGGVVTNYTLPPELLNEGVQVVAATGASVTLTSSDDNGYPTTMHDLTLTAATVAVAFPQAAAGSRRSVLYRQDTTGGRTVTTPGVVNRASGAITLQTAAGAADLVEYISIGGNSWRVYNHVAYAAPTTTAAAAPTIRGGDTFGFGGTTGTSNALTSVTTSALPTGITATDKGRMIVVRDGNDILGGATADGPQPTTPTGWTQTAKQSGNSMTTWTYERDMAAADSGTTITVTFSAACRINVAGAVIAGGTNTDQQRIATLDSTADLELTIPSYTPTADNSRVLVLAGMRFGSSTGPTVTPPSDWTELRETTEGRSAAVNFTAYAATKALTGQGGLQQSGAAFTLTGANAHDQSYLYVIKPA